MDSVEDPRGALQVDDMTCQRQLAARRLEDSRVYEAVRCLRSVRTFMEHHAVCVLDFMSLLKRLQVELTCVASPWTPSPDPVSARLINAIVLDEESDAAFGQEPRSHYGWYIAAMEEIGADTWKDRVEIAGALTGLRVLGGFAKEVARVMGDTEMSLPVSDALLGLAPTLIQVFGCRSEDWPQRARAADTAVGFGGIPDACYMWRRGGPLHERKRKTDPLETP